MTLSARHLQNSTFCNNQIRLCKALVKLAHASQTLLFLSQLDRNVIVDDQQNRHKQKSSLKSEDLLYIILTQCVERQGKAIESACMTSASTDRQIAACWVARHCFCTDHQAYEATY